MSTIFKHRTHKIYPKIFPEPWASGWGEDEFGLWMSFTYKDVIQVFRWCEPGEFLMGSPKDEPERSRGETQHKVELSKGFWIADTTVTQALWQAVMGNNPVNLKFGNNPINSVSWQDAQAFIEKMNTLKPELKLCLPSEAQWEYACRAGTETPFYFGSQIDSSVVNFDGNYPYGKTKISEYRKQAVEVKSLPPNYWGLYEMHGNLLEWCQDCYRVYPSSASLEVAIKDPLEVNDRRYRRVLRGGSWGDLGRGCRSAFRHDSGRLRGRYYIGFRLARGH